jgi:hypothetical protein
LELENYTKLYIYQVSRIVTNNFPELKVFINKYKQEQNKLVKKSKKDKVISLVKQRKSLDEITNHKYPPYAHGFGQPGKAMNYIRELGNNGLLNQYDVNYYIKQYRAKKSKADPQIHIDKRKKVLRLINNGTLLGQITRQARLGDNGKTIVYLVDLENQGVISQEILENYIEQYIMRRIRQYKYYKRFFKPSYRGVLRKVELRMMRKGLI